MSVVFLSCFALNQSGELLVGYESARIAADLLSIVTSGTLSEHKTVQISNYFCKLKNRMKNE